MNNNVTNFEVKKHFKDTIQSLDSYIGELKALSDNPRLAQGLIPVLNAAIAGLSSFYTQAKDWVPALRSNIKTGPDDHLEAVNIEFYSDIPAKFDGGVMFMLLSLDLSPEWLKGIEETLKGVLPIPAENVIPTLNQFSEIDGEDIINNFAHIEFGIVANLRDLGFDQYVLTNETEKVTVCVSRKDKIAVIQTIYNQVHFDDHLFLKNYGK